MQLLDSMQRCQPLLICCCHTLLYRQGQLQVFQEEILVIEHRFNCYKTVLKG
jgi:hypothetical protein